MAFGTDSSNPTRFLQGQSATDSRALALQQFGGEVLAAFDLQTIFKNRIQTKALPKGSKGWRFPKVWKATAEYHTPGKEMLGNPIATTDILVTPDDLLVAHTAIADLDEMLSHFDVSSQFSFELGRALARYYDKNVARALVLAARLAADGPFPAGYQTSDDTLKSTSGVFSGLAWINAIRNANLQLFAKDVPEDMPRYLAVSRPIFNAIKFAQDASGRYLILDSFLNPDRSGSGGIPGRTETIEVDGVTIIPTRNLPTTNETTGVDAAGVAVYPKYQADYSKTLGVLWTDMSIASVMLRDVSMETFRDVRRQENFMVASMLNGLGTLRGECTVEFNSVTAGT